MRAPPKLPEERIQAADLGEVVVRGFTYSERREFLALEGGDVQMGLEMLARCVREPDSGEPVYDAAGWDAYCAVRSEDATRMIEAARRVCGLDGEALEKN